MSVPDTATPLAVGAFREDLIAAGVLLPSMARGVGAWSADFERVLRGLDGVIVRASADQGATERWFPPVMPRDDMVRCGYLKSFPNLLGSISVFTGDEREHRAILERVANGQGWGEEFHPTDLALAPAVCHPLYATLTGTAPEDGYCFAVDGMAYRQEPSDDPVRVRHFRMRELVRLGTQEQVAAFRKHWLEHGPTVLRSLGLDVIVDVANDPFFGRGGKVLAANQREQVLKHEMLVPVSDPEKRTAVGSVNYHETHFGDAFGIRMPDGSACHSSCVGFGKERIVLALFRAHGMRPDEWPLAVREALGL